MAVIDFYRNLSDHNVVGKSKFLSFSKTGYFRDGASITDPVFTIDLEVEDVLGNITNSAQIMAINYCFIPDFKRYYFITDISCIRTGLWQFSCHVDVLETYAVELQLQRAIIARQENLYNLYLPDDRIIVTSQRKYTTIDFPNKLTPATGELADSLVVTLAGGAAEQSN